MVNRTDDKYLSVETVPHSGRLRYSSAGYMNLKFRTGQNAVPCNRHEKA
jgi:hypothetical protein